MKIVSYISAVQYTGSNSAAIVAEMSSCSIVSEGGGVLVLTGCFANRTVNTGEWVLHNGFCVVDVRTTASMNSAYAELPASEDALTGAGIASVPGISIIGSNVNVDVQISPTQTSSTYAVNAYLTGAAGSLTINSITVIDADTVRVNVSSSLVYVSGAQVVVTVH